MIGKKQARQTGDVGASESARASGWTRDSDQDEGAYLLYDELVNTRDRLAGLPPLVPSDLECAARALYEVVFFLITPPRGRKTALAMPEAVKARLVEFARNRDLDLYVMVTALVASRLARRAASEDLATAQLDSLRSTLDSLTFDYRRPKRETLTILRAAKTDIEGRIAYVSKARKSAFRFRELPELYARRSDKRERPDQFFHRVYGSHVSRGLTQADIRTVDPAYYNVLHVWCTRHKKTLSALVPGSRARGI